MYTYTFDSSFNRRYKKRCDAKKYVQNVIHKLSVVSAVILWVRQSVFIYLIATLNELQLSSGEKCFSAWFDQTSSRFQNRFYFIQYFSRNLWFITIISIL